MRLKQALPYFAAFVLLVWALGSLARNGTGGAGILTSSHWLVYLVYLIPVLAIVAVSVMAFYLVLNWREVSDAIGYGIARRKRQGRRKSNPFRLILMIGMWGLAFAVISWRCGGIICQPGNSTQTLGQSVAGVVENGQPVSATVSALQGLTVGLADLIGSGWFAAAFLVMLILSSVIVARGLKVSWGEREPVKIPPLLAQETGTRAVDDGLRVLETQVTVDPRAGIIMCYELMIKAAASLGANVSVDQTARELEEGIRDTFQLQGRGIAELTRLFEVARYSLHPITEEDREKAIVSLKEIREELRALTTLEN